MEISLLPIIVAVFLNMALGMTWYSPNLFGQQWATALGFDMKKLKVTWLHYVGAIGATLVTVLATDVFIRLFHIDTLMEAIKFGILIWLGFLATSNFSGVLWAKKPLKVYFIDTGYLLVITLLNTILLTLWK